MGHWTITKVDSANKKVTLVHSDKRTIDIALPDDMKHSKDKCDAFIKGQVEAHDCVKKDVVKNKKHKSLMLLVIVAESIALGVLSVLYFLK